MREQLAYDELESTEKTTINDEVDKHFPMSESQDDDFYKEHLSKMEILL